MNTLLPTYDVTARKAHQWVMVAVVLAAFVLQGVAGPVALLAAGLVMLAGRFWWPADVVRQLVWRALEPAGVLKRKEVHEDRETRRLARTIGGAIWFLSGSVLLLKVMPLAWTAWSFSLAIVGMVALDAAFDFCALCFVFLQLERRGLLPGPLRHGPGQVVGER